MRNLIYIYKKVKKKVVVLQEKWEVTVDNNLVRSYTRRKLLVVKSGCDPTEPQLCQKFIILLSEAVSASIVPFAASTKKASSLQQSWLEDLLCVLGT